MRLGANFVLEPFSVNGKTFKRLIGSAPPDISQEEATKTIRDWSGKMVFNRNAKEAAVFFQGIKNFVFHRNGVQVVTSEVEIGEA